ncbi:alkaline phosphatase PhoX [Streptomyces goshikiensis]|uniref:alkaline phosphatase PhoX n=1 Tax=Streptomyces goshikiensis TaxID=1942 RepID=UPI00364949A0
MLRPDAPSRRSSGEWIPLATGTSSCVPGMTAEEVFVFTRPAVDKGGRHEDGPSRGHRAAPGTGRRCARPDHQGPERRQQPGVGEANPRKNNKHGRIPRLDEHRSDVAATRFAPNRRGEAAGLWKITSFGGHTSGHTCGPPPNATVQATVQPTLGATLSGAGAASRRSSRS